MMGEQTVKCSCGRLPHTLACNTVLGMEASSIAPRQGMDLFTSRPGVTLFGGLPIGPSWEEVVEAIDWSRVLIEAEGLHQRTLREDRTHSRIVGGCPTETCGPCLRAVLLDQNWAT